MINNETTTSTKKAFTMIELLVVMALIMFLALLILPGSINQVQTAKLSSRISELSSQIYSYQQNAYTGLSNKNFGIKFNSNSYEVFVGNTYASAESKQTIGLDAGVTISAIALVGGGSEIDFVKGSLKPNTTGSLKMSDSSGTYQLTINQEGFVEYTLL